MKLDPNNDVIMAGYMDPNLNLGGMDLDPGPGVFHVESLNGYLLYVMKWSQCSVDSSTAEATSCGAYEWEGTSYTQSGIYPRTLTSAHGCDSVCVLTFTALQTGVAITANGATLTVTDPQPDVTYQWVDCIWGTEVAGATASTFIPLTNSSYAVVATRFGCADTSACIGVWNTGTEQASIAEVSVYPNPTAADLCIQCTNAGAATYAVFDGTGRCVQQGILHQQRTTLRSQILPAGLYQLHIINGDGRRSVFSIVKQ